jgi:hypothetical protein
MEWRIGVVFIGSGIGSRLLLSTPVVTSFDHVAVWFIDTGKGRTGCSEPQCCFVERIVVNRIGLILGYVVLLVIGG